jgi:hypothetical protein
MKLSEQTLALLKALALTNRQVEEGGVRPIRKAFNRVRDRLKA